MRPRCGEKGHGHQHPAPRGLTQLSPCPGDRLKGFHRQPHGSTLNLDFHASLSTRWRTQSSFRSQQAWGAGVVSCSGFQSIGATFESTDIGDEGLAPPTAQVSLVMGVGSCRAQWSLSVSSSLRSHRSVGARMEPSSQSSPKMEPTGSQAGQHFAPNADQELNP